jgi:hypothetical protein
MILDDLVTGFPIPWLSPSLKSNCFDNGNNYVVDRLSLLWSAILLGAEALSSGSFKKSLFFRTNQVTGHSSCFDCLDFHLLSIDSTND